jgi:menaquinone-dependent protoporphyrinogen oxidase
MARALIIHASRHGGSTGIAERMGEVIREAGVEAVVASARDLPDPRAFDGCIVGAGVYMGSWVEDGIKYLDRYAPTLARMPVWLFSSGPLRGSTKTPAVPADPIEVALGPSQGPGSGGRRKVEAVAERIHPREHRVFSGMFDPDAPPANLAERFVRLMPGSKGILPEGDFREWPEIEQWAREIATTLTEAVPVG